jgi:hypothetical protein
MVSSFGDYQGGIMKKRLSKKRVLRRETLDRLAVVGGIRPVYSNDEGCNSFYTCNTCAYGCTNDTCDPISEYACCVP